MTDPNEDRWRQLAEEFGLDDKKPTKPAPPPQQRSPEPYTEPSPLVEKVKDAALLPPRFEERELAHSLPDDAERPAAEPGGAAPPEGEEREGRRRGRRGRRRGRGGEKEPAGEERPAAAAPAGAAPAADESSEEKPGRRRGRRGRRPERPEPVEVEADLDADAEVEDDDLEMELPARVEEDDDELEDASAYSNWTVPSWQELIAALYRPER